MTYNLTVHQYLKLRGLSRDLKSSINELLDRYNCKFIGDTPWGSLEYTSEKSLTMILLML